MTTEERVEGAGHREEGGGGRWRARIERLKHGSVGQPSVAGTWAWGERVEDRSMVGEFISNEIKQSSHLLCLRKGIKSALERLIPDAFIQTLVVKIVLLVVRGR